MRQVKTGFNIPSSKFSKYPVRCLDPLTNGLCLREVFGKSNTYILKKVYLEDYGKKAKSWIANWPLKNCYSTLRKDMKGCAIHFSQASFNKGELCIFLQWSCPKGQQKTPVRSKTCPSFFSFWSCWWWTFEEKTAFFWGCIWPKSHVFGSIWIHRWFKTATWEPLKEYVYSKSQVPIFNVPDVHHLLRLEEGKLYPWS